MSELWYEKDPQLYETVREEVESAYAELHFPPPIGIVLITGYYPLFEGDRVWDRYHIRLQLAQDSPLGLSTVYEIGDRIPRTPDRHMEPDGKACIVLPDAYWHEHPQGMNLLGFLNGPVRSFFVNQSLRDLGQPDVWKHGEWRHGTDGIIEFYASVLRTNDPKTILAYLGILKRGDIKGHWACPCGSGRRLRNCHLGLVSELRTRIPQTVILESEKKLAARLARFGINYSSRTGGQGA